MREQKPPEQKMPQVAVAQIGAGLWAVRRSGHCLGYYHAVGDANRAARATVKCHPELTLKLAG